jgi:ABC-type multidrug transport system permease subunit
MQPVIQALPLTALVDALRRIYNEGATLVAVAGELGILAAWGVGSFILAAKRFRWQ